jgi:hypothetical protein
MYRWYQNALVCDAYLADIQDIIDLEKTKWFTRGWTLVVRVLGDDTICQCLGGRMFFQRSFPSSVRVGKGLSCSVQSERDMRPTPLTMIPLKPHVGRQLARHECWRRVFGKRYVRQGYDSEGGYEAGVCRSRPCKSCLNIRSSCGQHQCWRY